MTRRKRRLTLTLLLALLLAAAGTSAWADPARSVWVPPDSGYIDKPGQADWGWAACTCNPKDYKGDFCATDRDPGCGGNPANQGGIWEWETRLGYWASNPPATVAGSLSCTLGLGGWCISAATVTVSGSEPVAGYSITSIQGTDAGAPYSRPGALAVFNFGDTPGRTLTYQAVSSYGDSSYAGSLTARVDTMAPAVSAAASGPAGLGGWYRGPVQVSVSASDATSGVGAITLDGAAYAGPKTYSAQGANPYTYSARDLAGNTSSPQAGTLWIDSVAPSASVSIAGTTGNGAWFLSPVQVSVSGWDATSGLAGLFLDGAGYTGPNTYSTQGANAYSYYAQDAAGNTGSPQSGTFWIDSIPPAVSPLFSGTPGANGWFISPVQVTLLGSDAGSGLAGLSLDGLAYTIPQLYSAQGSRTFTYAAGDVAGNSSGTLTGALRIDTAPPTASAAAAGTLGDNSWYVSPVIVSVSGTDSASGVAALTLDGAAYAGPCTYSGQGTTTYTYSARDVAGLSSAAQSGSFKIDSLPPTASLAVSGPAGANGWYTGPVQVSISGADAASGLAGLTLNGAAYAGPQTINADGQTTLTYTAADSAGNSSGTQTTVVKIDSVPPAASHSLAGTLGDNGWFVSPVQVTVAGADVTSGVAGLTLDSAVYAGPRTYAAEGETTVTYAARDIAGNPGALETATFRVDTIAPTVSAMVSGLAGDAGWYRGPVTVEVAGADTTSGLADLNLDGQLYTGPREFRAEGETAVTYAGRDVAGNVSAEQTTAFRIDATAPALDLDWAGTPGHNGWYVSPVTVSLTAEDPVSGLAGLQLGGSAYTGPSAYSAEGVNIVDYAGRDVAGNSASGNRVFRIDTEPPVITAAVAGVAGEQGWYVSPVTVTISGSDATAGLDSLSLNGAPYSGPWVIQAQGETALTFDGQDRAGNSSEALAGQVRIDTAAPVVTATLAGRLGSNGWYVSPVTVTLAAGDSTSGLAGVLLDDTPYAAPHVFAAEGQTTVSYTATDVAGNHSTRQTQAFRIDTQPPATRPTLIGLPGRGGWYLGPVLVILSAEDATSGADHILLDGQMYTGPRLFPAGTITATFQAVDRAGNIEPARTLVFNADGTPPMTTATLGGTRGEDGWFTSAVIVTLAAKDDVSGVAQVWLNGWPGTSLALDAEGQHTVAFAAEDLAGNRELTQTLTVRIDRTPPELTVNAASQPDGTLALDVQAHDAGSGVQGGVVGILVDGQLVQWWNFAGESVHIEWDGSLPAGHVLSPGTYTVWAAARDAAGLEATIGTDAVLVPVATPPAPTATLPASVLIAQPTAQPTPALTPEPPATEIPLTPPATEAATLAAPTSTVTQVPAPPQPGAQAAVRNAPRGLPAWVWALAAILPALALAFGAVQVVDPRPQALRRLAALPESVNAFSEGDLDD